MITVNMFDAQKAKYGYLTETKSGYLKFYAESKYGEHLTLFVPHHVAEHTAAAFNRAMQAVPDGDGWTYKGDSGVWNISRFDGPFTVYRAQHDEITGDNDPSWMFADARSLIGCLDEIDNIEIENCCSRCNALVGDDNLRDCDPHYLCENCDSDMNEAWQASREMAEDDMAHAMMERNWEAGK